MSTIEQRYPASLDPLIDAVRNAQETLAVHLLPKTAASLNPIIDAIARLRVLEAKQEVRT